MADTVNREGWVRMQSVKLNHGECTHYVRLRGNGMMTRADTQSVIGSTRNPHE